METPILATTEKGLVDLVQFALHQDERGGTRNVLQWIARVFGAQGAVLWEVSPERDDWLFTVADWIEDDGRWSRHDLPRASSLTGQAIAAGRPIVAGLADTRVNSRDGLLSRYGIQTVACFPVVHPGWMPSALSLLWKAEFQPSTEMLGLGQEFAQILPQLHHSIQTAFRFQLVSSVREKIDALDVEGDNDETAAHEHAKGLIKGIVDQVAEKLGCLEVSVFLEDPLAQEGLFACQGTTNDRFVYRKKPYEARLGEGLTPYVLRTRRAIQIFDLRHFVRDKDMISDRYIGLTLRDRVEFIDPILRQELGPDSGPISFMAAPIELGLELLGVIRCCTARRSPHYFSPGDSEALEMIATQIGQYWHKFLRGMELTREIGVWRRYAEFVQASNLVAARELQQPENEQDRVLQRLLEGLVPVLPFTDVIDIRLKTEEINALRYAAASGRLWNQQTTEERTKRLAHSYPLEEQGTKSVGAHVFHTQRLHHVFNTNDDPHYHALFPELRQEITVPISLNEQRYGVLTIGTTESIVPLGGYVEDVAKMLGQQLGLYLNLAESVGMIRKSETVQRQAFEDLQHQIKSPLGKAYLRTQRALQTHAGNSESTPDLLALRGLIGKAKQIASSLGLFVQLARGEKLTCRPLELKRDRIYKGISEICEDNRLLYQRTTQTTFELGMNGFEGPDGVSIWIDSDLFLQAANNVIDNAFKYSLPKSVVCVNAHLDQLYFSLVVSSQGLPILCSEVETFKKRGERGSEAKLVTGEGSGLGLWLVDNIMKAHHGRLEIDPTDESGRTIVRLLFPRKRTTA